MHQTRNPSEPQPIVRLRLINQRFVVERRNDRGPRWWRRLFAYWAVSGMPKEQSHDACAAAFSHLLMRDDMAAAAAVLALEVC